MAPVVRRGGAAGGEGAVFIVQVLEWLSLRLGYTLLYLCLKWMAIFFCCHGREKNVSRGTRGIVFLHTVLYNELGPALSNNVLEITDYRCGEIERGPRDTATPLYRCSTRA